MELSLGTGAAALLPSIYLLWYFITNDRYPEPKKVLMGTFARGVFICLPVIIVGQILMYLTAPVSSEIFHQLFQAFVVAALCEEGFKLYVLDRYCNKTGHLDEPMDAVVYGVVVSLGFATLENVLYVSQGGLQVALMRAFTAVPAHAAFGAIMGYGYAKYRFGFGGSRLSASGVLFMPFLIHGLYDAPLFLLQVDALTERSGVTPALHLGFIALGVWMYRRVRSIMAEMKAHQLAQSEDSN